MSKTAQTEIKDPKEVWIPCGKCNRETSHTVLPLRVSTPRKLILIGLVVLAVALLSFLIPSRKPRIEGLSAEEFDEISELVRAELRPKLFAQLNLANLRQFPSEFRHWQTQRILLVERLPYVELKDTATARVKIGNGKNAENRGSFLLVNKGQGWKVSGRSWEFSSSASKRGR